MVDIYLLDVNILVALLDREHIHHGRAMRWFMQTGVHGWASCPVTENGVIRIMSRPGYTSPSFSPRYATDLLRSLIRNSEHRFIPEDMSILDSASVNIDQITSYHHVTDTFLLALAKRHGAMLATMDMSLSVSAVPDGVQYLLKLP